LDGFADQTNFQSIRTSGSAVSFTSASWSSEASVYFNGKKVLEPRDLQLDVEYLTRPEILTFPTGADNEDVAYAIFYAPANPDMSGPTHDKPPLIVLAHGGPTSAARSQLSLPIRFWTSRGFAVVDVNYRGSSGFGRAYRKKLDGNWGIADVEDCVCVAQYLVERGDVDPHRLIIRGGSAGGFTVLSALAFHDTFTAGASMYGVADLEALANDTHKFESRYLDGLIGPWPEAEDVYKERSPINHIEGFDAPMIILQGSEDAIVPPNQSRMIVDALDKRGIPVAYIEFEGEQHGFRQSTTIVTAIQSELAFYGRVFGFIPSGEPMPLEIRNLE
jgi:dipeptidyl aminopeptidase/acylaminoacyl peptidase